MQKLALCALLVGCSGRGAPVAPAVVGNVPAPIFERSSYAMTIEAPVAPWSLTASDGSGLVMTRVEAKAVVQGPLAFTELHVWFHNPEDRVREGRFEITLPARAAVSRFAMESDGQWMEAEVVEKMAARRAYEDFLHRGQDPALLEKAAGNQFSARVFPIPARSDKHLVLSFSQELAGEHYTLPLRGLPKIGRVDARLTTFGPDGRRSDQVLAERDWQPDRDFSSTVALAEAIGTNAGSPGPAAIAAPPAPGALGRSAGSSATSPGSTAAPSRPLGIARGPGVLVAAQVAVLDPSVPAADVPKELTLLVDTSASRSVAFGSAIRATSQLVAALRKRYGDRLELSVLAFDQTTQPIFSGPAGAWSATHEDLLAARGAAGASDLGQALAAAAAQRPRARLAIVTDGVVTAGHDTAELVAAARGLPRLERIDVLLAGGIRDADLAAALVRASSRPGAVIDLERGADDAAAALGERMLTDVAIDVPGASWSFPRTIASARPGARVMVYARLAPGARTLTAIVNRQRRTLPIADGAPALVERAIAAAEIAELEAKLAADPRNAALKTDIALRSVAARVVSSQTALLVLETEADYVRYGIHRTALADILEIGADGSVVQRHRTSISPLAIASAPPRATITKDAKQKRHEGRVGAEEPEETRDAAKLDDASGAIAGEAVAAGSTHGAAAPAPAEPPPAPPPPPPARAARPTVEALAQRPAAGSAAEAPRRPAPEPTAEPARVQALHGNTESRTLNIASQRPAPEWPPKDAPPALKGELASILADPRSPAAFAQARAWHLREPGNVLALIGLGEVLEARDERESAARFYGSIIDLYPGRADLRRFAGERLERVAARALAIDTYRRAVADRPDHLTGHRLLAYALLRAGRPADAFAAILAGIDYRYPQGRFRGGVRVLSEDAGLIGAAYAAAVPAARPSILAALAQRSLALATEPSTRFVLYWETDANDVDFHIQDAHGGHAYFSSKQLPSGGELFEDITNGYGPECFSIPGAASAFPYRLSINYYRQGPMGYGMGLLQIIRHDGRGALGFDDRPYVIMNDHAYVDLGEIHESPR